MEKVTLYGELAPADRFEGDVIDGIPKLLGTEYLYTSTGKTVDEALNDSQAAQLFEYILRFDVGNTIIDFYFMSRERIEMTFLGRAQDGRFVQIYDDEANKAGTDNGAGSRLVKWLLGTFLPKVLPKPLYSDTGIDAAGCVQLRLDVPVGVVYEKTMIVDSVYNIKHTLEYSEDGQLTHAEFTFDIKAKVPWRGKEVTTESGEYFPLYIKWYADVGGKPLVSVSPLYSVGGAVSKLHMARNVIIA